MMFIYSLTLVMCTCIPHVASDEYTHYVSATLHEYCPYTDMCTGRANQTVRDTNRLPCCNNCSCVNDCVLFGTCCPDAPAFIDSANNKPTDQDTYFRGNCISTMVPIGTMSERKEHNLNVPRMYAVDYCNFENKNSLMERLCTSNDPIYLTQLPFVSDDKGYVFRNQFCAKCNGVTNYTTWEMAITCENTKFAKQRISIDFLISNNCKVWSKLSNSSLIQHRLCHMFDYESCNRTLKYTNRALVETACNDNRFPVHIENLFVYKNIFCYICNQNQEPRKTCIDYPTHSRNGEISFQAILGGDYGTTEKDVNRKCSIGELFDIFEEKCRELKCPVFTYPEDGRCVDIFAQADGVIFRVKLRASLDHEPLVYTHIGFDLVYSYIEEVVSKQIGCAICKINILRLHDNATFLAEVLAGTDGNCSLSLLRRLDDVLRDINMAVRVNETVIKINMEVTSADMEYTEDSNFYRMCRDEGLNLTDIAACPKITMTGYEFKNIYAKHGIIPKHSDKTDILYKHDVDELKEMSLDFCVDYYFEMIPVSTSLPMDANINCNLLIIEIACLFILHHIKACVS